MMFILLIGCVLFSSASGQCPDGFLEYGVSCYHFSHDVATWYSSQVACSQAFFPTIAYLVEINSYQENHFLWRNAKAIKQHYWVGASELQTLKVYRWLKSGNVVNTPYWYPREPTGGSEHCMLISHESPTSNSWYDIGCSVNHHYICETPKKQS